ncbi:MAG: tyrosine decarboxylase MfnA [Candidatus Thorarchaeota archaeon]|jgi:tyrosine decarboxylase/aspartate 1-decarboxylase
MALDEQGSDDSAVVSELNSILEMDSTGFSGHPIASMSTIPHHLGVEVFSKTMERNAGRLHSFKSSGIIEQEVIEMIADLLHLNTPYGTTSSGGTESNILAMLAMRESKKKIKKPEIIAPKTVHSSIDKAAWILGIKLVKTGIDRQFKANTRLIEKRISENTVGIIATAGTTYLGQIDPIDEIGLIAKQNRIPLHIDAAFGGFVIPFLHDLGLGYHPFDFEIKGVTSISIDGHKMGLTPIPSGCLILRSVRHLNAITRKVPYLRGASSIQSSLLGTRPAGSILATWAILKHLGRSGYREIVRDCMKQTQLGKDRVDENPLLELVIDPVMNILAIESREVPLNVIVLEMERRGWRMVTSPMPHSLRLVIMPHVTTGAMNAFFNDLDEVSTTVPAD